MGEVIPFRRKRRWTRPEDYGHHPGKPPKPPKPPKSGRRRWLAGWRPWILLTLLVGLWVLSDPLLVEPPAFLSTQPKTVEGGSFTRCGPGRGTFCVVDGDTFKLGERKIRLVGIDAPETHPARCEAEAAKGEDATAELQRLLNQGPFVMTGRIDEPQDKYGRDLRSVTRLRPDGTTQSIARNMLESGTVRRYTGGLRRGWC